MISIIDKKCVHTLDAVRYLELTRYPRLIRFLFLSPFLVPFFWISTTEWSYPAQRTQALYLHCHLVRRRASEPNPRGPQAKRVRRIGCHHWRKDVCCCLRHHMQEWRKEAKCAVGWTQRTASCSGRRTSFVRATILLFDFVSIFLEFYLQMLTRARVLRLSKQINDWEWIWLTFKFTSGTSSGQTIAATAVTGPVCPFSTAVACHWRIETHEFRFINCDGRTLSSTRFQMIKRLSDEAETSSISGTFHESSEALLIQATALTRSLCPLRVCSMAVSWGLVSSKIS